MRLPLFEKITSNLFAENRLLKFWSLCITVGLFWLGHKVDDAVHHQRTILVPAGLDRRVSLTDGYASEDYIKVFARTVANLAFTYNTANARGQFGELLQYFTADAFPSAKQAFFSLADTIERTKLSSTIAITKPIAVDTEKGVITITGAQRQWVESNFIDTAEKTYFISYQLVDGKFMVSSIDEKKIGNAAAQTGKQSPIGQNPAIQPSTSGIKVAPEAGAQKP